ncbi:hypothetical protein F4809DRAFT_641278 [Biscogniauxia mediterranea]|nr:hypothetical protein F4809DRAFT_641278 [Biscogniauxia mediterranea]
MADQFDPSLGSKDFHLQEDSVFFRLPPVVRKMIYVCALPAIEPEDKTDAYGAEKLKHPGRLADYPPLMHTCKQVFYEMRPVACADVYMAIKGVMFNKTTIWGFGRLYPEYLRTLSIVYHMDIDRVGIPEALAWVGSRAPRLETLRLRFRGHPRSWLDLMRIRDGEPEVQRELLRRREQRRRDYALELLWFVLRGTPALRVLDLDGTGVPAQELRDSVRDMERCLGCEGRVDVCVEPEDPGRGAAGDPEAWGTRRDRPCEHDLETWFS